MSLWDGCFDVSYGWLPAYPRPSILSSRLSKEDTMWPFSRNHRTGHTKIFRSCDAGLDEEIARLARHGWQLDRVETDKYGHVRAHFIRTDPDESDG